MRAFLERWAPWLAGAVLLAGACAYVATRLVSGGAATPPAQPTTVALDPQARAVAKEFVATAVARKHLVRAWQLTAPELRQGMTLAQWRTGTIPVTPYPVGNAPATYTVQSSYPGDAVLRVTFVPPLASSTPAGDFLITLHRIDGKWLVTSWVPRQIVNAPGG